VRFKCLPDAPMKNIISWNLSVYRALEFSEDPLRDNLQGIRISLDLHSWAYDICSLCIIDTHPNVVQFYTSNTL
jgi:hypothetical protein